MSEQLIGISAFTKYADTVCRATFIAALIALVVLLLLGVWVGAFETFGGYVPRQNAFAITSLVLSIGVSAFLRFRAHARWLVVLAYFGVSHVFYVLGIALGQVAYVRAATAGDFHFLRTLILALNNQL